MAIQSQISCIWKVWYGLTTNCMVSMTTRAPQCVPTRTLTSSSTLAWTKKAYHNLITHLDQLSGKLGYIIRQYSTLVRLECIKNAVHTNWLWQTVSRITCTLSAGDSIFTVNFIFFSNKKVFTIVSHQPDFASCHLVHSLCLDSFFVCIRFICLWFCCLLLYHLYVHSCCIIVTWWG